MPSDPMPDEELRRIHEASPLAALSSHGYGPLTGWMPDPSTPAEDLVQDPTFQRIGLESLGATAHGILRVLDFHRGRLDRERWGFETAGADPDDLAVAFDRLQALRLVAGEEDGAVAGAVLGSDWFGEMSVSYDTPHAITSDRLAEVVKWWGHAPPGRKTERSALLRAMFADDGPAGILDRLSGEAASLFARIADAAGPRPVDAETVGIESYQLYMLEHSRNRYGGRVASATRLDPALVELVEAGLVGYDHYDRELWIWAEAWPLAERPLIVRWPAVPAPPLVARQPAPPRVGEVATVLARALLYWEENPPKVLKNNEPRFAKTDIRSAARELGVPESVAETASRFLIENELYLQNVVSASGRGRNRKIDSVWMADPDVVAAWSELSLIDQWLFIVQQWHSADHGSELAAAARQLVFYELLKLPPEVAWSDRKSAAAWLEHRYAPLTDAGEFEAILDEAAAIGLAESGVVALTSLGRQVLLDPLAARDADLGAGDGFIVQPDFSIVAPPDLAPDVASELAHYAVLESSAGALVYRLDESLITRAIQRGATADEVSAFLSAHASVPLPELVTRFVNDAARGADRFALHTASTVLVTTDPVDLADAVAVKAAKLVKVTDTVAVSALAPDKVRAALGRRKLEARILGASDERPTAQRSADKADVVAARAAQLAEHAERSGHEYFRAHAEQLNQQAERLRNPFSRFDLADRPLAFDPALAGHRPPDRGEGF